MELSEYEFEIIHRPGILNANADALSRIQIDPIRLLGEEPQKNKIDQKFEEANMNVVTRANKRRMEEENIEEILEEIQSDIKELNKLIIERDIVNYVFDMKNTNIFNVYPQKKYFHFSPNF